MCLARLADRLLQSCLSRSNPIPTLPRCINALQLLRDDLFAFGMSDAIAALSSVALACFDTAGYHRRAIVQRRADGVRCDQAGSSRRACCRVRIRRLNIDFMPSLGTS